MTSNFWRLKNFLRGWLLVLGLNECLVECGIKVGHTKGYVQYLRKRWLILLLILGEDDFPSETIQILTDHDEEVKYFFIFKEICQNIWKMDQITLPLILGILVVFCVPHEIRQLKFSINVCFRISTIWLFFEGFFTPFEKMKKKVWMSSLGFRKF